MCGMLLMNTLGKIVTGAVPGVLTFCIFDIFAHRSEILTKKPLLRLRVGMYGFFYDLKIFFNTLGVGTGT